MMDLKLNIGQCIFFTFISCISRFGQDNPENFLKPYFSAVVVSNAEQSSLWYQSVLGVKIRNVNENAVRGSKIIVLSSDDLLLELIEVKSQVRRQDVLSGRPEQTLIQGFAKIGFKVSDLDAWIRKMAHLKVNFFGDTYTDPVSGKRSFLIQDLDKNLVQFFE